MNNKLSITYLILIITSFFFGCGGTVTGQNNNTASPSSLSLHVGNEKYFTIDTRESIVAWTGSGVHGKQNGSVYISKGELMIENGQLMGGTIEVDMNTIENKHGRDNNLIKHLKDPDFFDVKKFPISTIAITKITTVNGENKTVTGNIKIKGITHPVTFPARVKVNGGIVKADAEFVIDRTKWDVRYRSGKFYDNLADQTISDDIEFQIKIVAKK